MRKTILAIAFLALSVHAQQVTIQHGSNLSDVINNLYGGDGIQLANTGHQAHFGVTEDFQQFSEALQKILQARPVFTVPSSVGVISFRYNDETGTYERIQDSFGPILTERATTSGRGHANLAISYNFSDFEKFNGNDSIPLVLTHCETAGCTGGNPNNAFLKDVINVSVHLKLKTQVIATSLTYGLADRFDVALVVPYIRNDLTVFTHAAVIVAPGSSPDIHQFDPRIETPDQLATGHAVGIGDMIGRAKFQLPLKLPIQIALLTDLTFPTGDKKNFLGTGDFRVKETFIVSKSGGRFSPHLNAGYEFNTSNSKLNSVDYRFGTEAVLNPRVTLVGDVIGNVQSRAEDEFTVRALNGQSLSGRSQIDGAFGAKWRLGPSSLLVLNYLKPLNDSGIRPNAVFTFGWQLGM